MKNLSRNTAKVFAVVLFYAIFISSVKSYAQNWDGAGGTNIHVDFSSLHQSSATNSGYTNNNRVGYSGPSASSVALGNTYSAYAYKTNEEGLKYWNKDWAKAARLFKKALAYSPDDRNIMSNYKTAEAYRESTLGDIAFAKGNYAKGLDYFREALAKLPGDPNITYRLNWEKGNAENEKARNYILKKDWGNAIKCFQNALIYLPDDQTVISNIKHASFYQTQELGEYFYSTGDWVNAAAYLWTSIKDFDYGRDDLNLNSKYTHALSELEKRSNGDLDFNNKRDEIAKQLPPEVVSALPAN